MSELLIAILVGVTISLTGCTKAGESTVSDYEQGGYFQEEQQIQQKEVESKANTNTTHNNTTQPTKINDKQQTESKHNSNRINNQQQHKKYTKGVDKVKDSSEEPKQDNQSTQQNTQQEATDTECAICGRQVHNGEGIELNDYPIEDSDGHIVSAAVIVHKYCYQHELDDNAKHDI